MYAHLHIKTEDLIPYRHDPFKENLYVHWNRFREMMSAHIWNDFAFFTVSFLDVLTCSDMSGLLVHTCFKHHGKCLLFMTTCSKLSVRPSSSFSHFCSPSLWGFLQLCPRAVLLNWAQRVVHRREWPMIIFDIVMKKHKQSSTWLSWRFGH